MAAADTGSRLGLIVANHGRHYVVEAAEGGRFICRSRGKKSEGVVGDRVTWQPSGDEGVIERLAPRRNLLYRRDEVRTKSFAANLDLILVFLAADPLFSGEQLARALVAARAEQVEVLIVLNKSDLANAHAQAWQRLLPYLRMGYSVLPLSLKPPRNGLDTLQAALEHKTTLVLGPSGAGKSTLINQLVPGAAAQTGDVSLALRSGKHTTTSTTWYWMDQAKASALIDSPGFQEFGLHHIEPMELQAFMPDIRLHADQCRFYNCTHLHEPGCAVIAALKADDDMRRVDADRYRLYRALFEELSQPPRY